MAGMRSIPELELVDEARDGMTARLPRQAPEPRIAASVVDTTRALTSRQIKALAQAQNSRPTKIAGGNRRGRERLHDWPCSCVRHCAARLETNSTARGWSSEALGDKCALNPHCRHANRLRGARFTLRSFSRKVRSSTIAST
jgi:hypothetical protein